MTENKYEKAKRLNVNETTSIGTRTFEVDGDSGTYEIMIEAHCGCPFGDYHRGYCSHILAVLKSLTMEE